MSHVSWQAYVINLPSAVDRWRCMQVKLEEAGVPFTRIEAILGRGLPQPYPEFDEVGHRRRTGRRPIPAEIGCYLSHLKAIDSLLESGQTHGLILEDDAVFAPGFRAIIDAALAQADAWDVLRLQTVNRDRVIPAFPIDARHALGVSLTRSKGAAAYVLSRKAAEVFRRRLRPMRLAYDIAFDVEYLWGLRAVAVTPHPITADETAPTQIQTNINSYKGGASRYLTVFPFRAAMEMARLTCRMPLLAGLWLRAATRRSGHRGADQ